MEYSAPFPYFMQLATPYGFLKYSQVMLKYGISWIL